MANRQREIDILNHLQDLILTGTRCFETDDIDCNRLLVDLRQGLRSLRLLQLQRDNFRNIEETLTTLIDQVDVKIQRRRAESAEHAFAAPRLNQGGTQVHTREIKTLYILSFLLCILLHTLSVMGIARVAIFAPW